MHSASNEVRYYRRHLFRFGCSRFQFGLETVGYRRLLMIRFTPVLVFDGTPACLTLTFESLVRIRVPFQVRCEGRCRTRWSFQHCLAFEAPSFISRWHFQEVVPYRISIRTGFTFIVPGCRRWPVSHTNEHAAPRASTLRNPLWSCDGCDARFSDRFSMSWIGLDIFYFLMPMRLSWVTTETETTRYNRPSFRYSLVPNTSNFYEYRNSDRSEYRIMYYSFEYSEKSNIRTWSWFNEVHWSKIFDLARYCPFCNFFS